MAARRSIRRAMGVLREWEERQDLELGRTASKVGATQSQQENTRNEGHAAPVAKGGQAEENGSYQARAAEEAGDGGPSEGFARAAGKPAAAYTGR